MRNPSFDEWDQDTKTEDKSESDSRLEPDAVTECRMAAMKMVEESLPDGYPRPTLLGMSPRTLKDRAKVFDYIIEGAITVEVEQYKRGKTQLLLTTAMEWDKGYTSCGLEPYRALHQIHFYREAEAFSESRVRERYLASLETPQPLNQNLISVRYLPTSGNTKSFDKVIKICNAIKAAMGWDYVDIISMDNLTDIAGIEDKDASMIKDNVMSPIFAGLDRILQGVERSAIRLLAHSSKQGDEIFGSMVSSAKANIIIEIDGVIDTRGLLKKMILKTHSSHMNLGWSKIELGIKQLGNNEMTLTLAKRTNNRMRVPKVEVEPEVETVGAEDINKVRLHLMKHPNKWLRPAKIGKAMGLDRRTVVRIIDEEIIPKGDLAILRQTVHKNEVVEYKLLAEGSKKK